MEIRDCRYPHRNRHKTILGIHRHADGACDGDSPSVSRLVGVCGRRRLERGGVALAPIYRLGNYHQSFGIGALDDSDDTGRKLFATDAGPIRPLAVARRCVRDDVYPTNCTAAKPWCVLAIPAQRLTLLTTSIVYVTPFIALLYGTQPLLQRVTEHRRLTAFPAMSPMI